jgi:tRNA modification GTPase
MGSRTIAALSSAKGRGAISVIRVSGCRAFEILEKCLEPQMVFRKSPARRVNLYTFVSPLTENPVDQVTAVKYVGPASFTGEDMVELFCHGGEFVAEKILSALVDGGADLADRGEFTRRAFLNGKFDLLHAEAILGIIESRSKREYEASLEAFMGESSRRLAAWRDLIKNLVRDVDASIEFPEEEDVQNSTKMLIKRIAETRKDMERELNLSRKSHSIEKGIIVPIVGIPNAGKSSLFNLLVGYDRSIVHWKEGTTRDGVGEEVEIADQRVTLLDTAGLRDADNDVEKIGIKKTREYMGKASLVIWVTPADAELTSMEEQILAKEGQSKFVAVISKRDLADTTPKERVLVEKKIPFVSCCLLDTKDRENLVAFAEVAVRKRIGPIAISSVLLAKRHESLAARIVEELRQAENNGGAGEEVAAAGLRRALSLFAELIGETTNEEILASIFSQFCIGK